ncbi:hypothetical protein [Mycoplasma seminis]|uniref:Uncharacterized protein n=1 Tax=Mycoplasma seminis TaxID=512749 RepID=A0ABY9H9C6_9MOLU|nr:hypothetical protein [Mycoplasma seminis]WLP85194.1 hypothetical protein Q8852_02630 [Mycoplasma seminis]
MCATANVSANVVAFSISVLNALAASFSKLFANNFKYALNSKNNDLTAISSFKSFWALIAASIFWANSAPSAVSIASIHVFIVVAIN